jgi:hypothetical protein
VIWSDTDTFELRDSIHSCRACRDKETNVQWTNQQDHTNDHKQYFINQRRIRWIKESIEPLNESYGWQTADERKESENRNTLSEDED